MTEQLKTETICTYCQNTLEDEVVFVNNKNYCCYGCATLDDVVSQIKNNVSEVKLKYKQFDIPTHFDKLVDYQNENIYKVSISLPNIHCSSCIELLEDLPSFNEHILRSHVNFEQQKCTVSVDKKLPLSFVSQLLEDIGYPPQLSVNQKKVEEEKQKNKETLLKMAVAGFCFGNIMLFSMPHYFGLEVQNDPFFAQLFSGLSMVLSLPVVFYAGRGYLTSAYKSLAAGKSHINIPIALGILSLFAWSFYEIISGQGIGYLDSLAGLIFFLLIGQWFQGGVYDQVSFHRNITEFIPLVVRYLGENGKEDWKRIDELNKGDKILVKNEEIIPVNGELMADFASVDYAFITGEANRESVKKGMIVYAGGCQKSGNIIVQVTEKPSIDKLWQTWNTQSEDKDFQNHWTQKISKIFTITVIGIAVMAAIAWSFVDIHKAIFVFSAVLIVACPCALALSAPFTFGNILRIFSKNNFFVKNPEAIYTLSHVNHIVLDKTGTITEKDSMKVDFHGPMFSSQEWHALKAVLAQSKHPLSEAIYHHRNHFGELPAVFNFEEVSGKGIKARVNDLDIKLGSAAWLNAGIKTENQAVVYVQINEELRGHFTISLAFRANLKNVLNQLGTKNQISILSGDNAVQKSALEEIYPAFAHLNFGLKPAQKAEKIRTLKQSQTVCMVGDGLNDSSAIQAGNLGIAITESLNGFYPGSDAVLLSESFGNLPKFFDLAQYSRNILKISLVFSLIYNITGVAFAVAGMLTPIIAAILMPLSSISVVLLVTYLVQSHSKKIKLT